MHAAESLERPMPPPTSPTPARVFKSLAFPPRRGTFLSRPAGLTQRPYFDGQPLTEARRSATPTGLRYRMHRRVEGSGLFVGDPQSTSQQAAEWYSDQSTGIG